MNCAGVIVSRSSVVSFESLGPALADSYSRSHEDSQVGLGHRVQYPALVLSLIVSSMQNASTPNTPNILEPPYASVVLLP